MIQSEENGFKTIEELNTFVEKQTKGAFSTLDMEVLVPEVKKLVAGDIYVEVGVDKGKSFLCAYYSSVDGVRLYGVDINGTSIFFQILKDLPRAKFINEDSSDAGKSWSGGKISLIHIDGDHSYKGCKADIDSWYPHMKDQGVMLFHDCDESSPGVMWAISEFVYRHKVNKFQLFKRTDKNTSMALIQL